MRRAIFGLVAVSTLLAGCASEGWFKLKKDAFPVSSAKNPVVRILAVWQVGEGQGPDGLTTRGFVGQIFFLDAEDQIPARVDGEVRVYVFDDQGTPEDRDKPFHQFDYPRDSWKVRETKTKMGPAYAIFIPYTRKGSHKATCSLRLRFVPAHGGPPSFSDMAQVTLPGRDGSPQEQFALERSRARTAEHLAGNAAAEAPKTEASHRPGGVQVASAEAPAAGTRPQVRSETIRPTAPAEPAGPTRAPLTETDRRRLVAEALARAAREGLPVAGASDAERVPTRRQPIRHAGYDDEAEAYEEADADEEYEAPAPRTVRRAPAPKAARRGPHPLLREQEAAEELDEEVDAEEFAERRAPAPARRRAVSHPLLRDRGAEESREESDAEFAADDELPAPARRVTNRLSRAHPPRDEEPRPPVRHTYDDADDLADEAVASGDELDRLEQEAIDELARMTAAGERSRRRR